MLRRIERSVPPAGSFIDVDGTRLHYVDRGSGEPIVMIHGLSGVLQNFTYSLAERLAGRFRVIAIDRPGAGYSQRPRGASAHLSAQAATIAAFMKRLDLPPCIVVGHSLGAAIALVLALDHPQRVRALALIAPLTQPLRRAPWQFRALQIHTLTARTLIAYTIAIPIAAATARMRARAVFSPEPVPRDFATKGGGLLALRASQFLHASNDMMAAREDMPQLVARYGLLRLPVHVLFGTQDALLDYRRHAEIFRTQVPHADVKLVPGGHMLPVTQPNLCASWIAEIAR